MPNTQQHYDIPLHDIKPLIEIQEYSFYYLSTLIVIGILVVLGILYLIYKWFQNRDRFNIRKEHFKLMNSLNLKESKKSAYLITLYGETFKDDSPRHLEMYNNLTERLELYKYKKDVDMFESEVLSYIALYKGMIDV